MLPFRVRKHLVMGLVLVLLLATVYKSLGGKGGSVGISLQIKAGNRKILRWSELPRLGRRLMVGSEATSEWVSPVDSQLAGQQLLLPHKHRVDSRATPEHEDLPADAKFAESRRSDENVHGFLPSADSKSFEEWKQALRAGCAMAGDEESILGHAAQNMPFLKQCLTLERGASALQWLQRVYETAYTAVSLSIVAVFGWLGLKLYSCYKACCGSSDASRVYDTHCHAANWARI